jgi:hypothetical protein
MTAVRQLADQQLTVLCTIHQPSVAISELFHSLLLLAAGKVIYFGPFQGAVAYFTEQVHKFPFTAGTNPADFLLRVAEGKYQDGGNSAVKAEELAQSYAGSSSHAELLKLLDAKEAARGWEKGVEVSGRQRSVRYHTSTWSQIYFLCRRAVLRNFKDPTTVLSYLVRHVAVSLFYGSLYYKMPGGTATSAYTNRLALIVYAVMFVTFCNIQQVAAVFQDRLVFYRERAASAYGALPHFIATFVVSVPACCVNVFVFSAVLYNMAGLDPDPDRFLFFYFVLLVCSVTGLCLCHLVANCCSNVNETLTVLPVFIFPSILVSGFVVALPDLPTWLRAWAPYLSFVRWSFQALVLNEFSDNPNLPYGDYFLVDFGFTTISKEACSSYVVIFAAIFFVAAFASLKLVDFERR